MASHFPVPGFTTPIYLYGFDCVWQLVLSKALHFDRSCTEPIDEPTAESIFGDRSCTNTYSEVHSTNNGHRSVSKSSRFRFFMLYCILILITKSLAPLKSVMGFNLTTSTLNKSTNQQTWLNSSISYASVVKLKLRGWYGNSVYSPCASF